MRFFLILAVCAFALTEPAFSQVRRMAMSPDGSAYAALSKAEDGTQYVIVYDAGDAAAQPIFFDMGPNETGRFYLAGDNFALVEISNLDFAEATVSGLNEFSASRWVSLNLKSGKSVSFFDHLDGYDLGYVIEHSGQVLATSPRESQKAIFARIDISNTNRAGASRFNKGDDELTYDLHGVDLKNGRVRGIKAGQPETRQWIVDKAGEIVARVDYIDRPNQVRFFLADGGGFKLGSTVEIGKNGVKDIGVVGRAAEAGALIVRVTDMKNAISYRRYDMAAGAFLQDAYVPKGAKDNIAEIYDPQKARAHALIIDGGARVHHFHAEDRSLQETMEKTIAGASVFIESMSADGARTLIRAYYADKPTEWYLFDSTANRLEIVARN